jgi:YHS domain-containing protein
MCDLTAFERRVQERLAETDERRRLRQNHLEQRMREFDERHRQYTELADRIMQTIIGPRMRKLAEHFDNAKFPEEDQPHRHHCLCCLERSERFPASVRLELAVNHDADYETVQVQYRLEILPVFFAFKDKDQLAFPRGAVDEKRLAAWVDDRLIEFLDSYLQLEVTDQYHRDNVATDPVCGMEVNKAVATARMEYRNQTYYCCLDECRQKFAADPECHLAHGSPQA